MAPGDLAHALPMLLPNKGMPAAEALERVEEVSASRELPVEDLQRLRLRQQRNAQLFERQKSRVQSFRCHNQSIGSTNTPLVCSFA